MTRCNDGPKRHARLLLVLFATVLILATATAAAQGRGAVRKAIENSMVVTGSVDIEPDGSVSAHVIDRPEKLPQGVRDLVSAQVPGFRFEPVLVEGKAVRARTKMRLRVIARQVGDGQYGVGIGSANFGSEKPIPGEEITPVQMRAPSYPPAAYTANVSGTVFVFLKVGRDGKVLDAVAGQTNLTAVGTEQQMRDARRVLEQASVSTARRWRFAVPTTGAEAGRDYWTVRVPVDFMFHGAAEPPYGKWAAYVPGPRTLVPWLSAEDNRANPDAQLAGAPQLVGSGPKLLTPLQG